MTITVPVIFEKGNLKLLEPVSLPENETILATLEFGTSLTTSPNDRSIEERVRGIKELAAHYRSLDLPTLPDEAFERESFYEN